MTIRDLDDDLRIDVPKLLERLAVELPRLFHDDGTPTAVIAPLRLPTGVSPTDVMVGGWDFDGELGDAGSLRIAGLRLPKIGYYIADDDPLRSAASVLYGRLPRWPASLDETVAQDEEAALSSASAPAVMRRVNCTLRDISIAKDVLRGGGTLGAVMIAALQASDALTTAEVARDAARVAMSGTKTSDECLRLVEVARERSADAVRACLTLLELLDRHRVAVKPDEPMPHEPGNEEEKGELDKSRLAVMASARLIVRVATLIRLPRHTAPRLAYRNKQVSEALILARTLIDGVLVFVRDHHAGAPGSWSTLRGNIPNIKEPKSPQTKPDTAIELLPRDLNKSGNLLGLDKSGRDRRIAAITRIDAARIFMLLHSARVAEAVRLFPWLAARHRGFPDFSGGFADGVTVLLELQRCRAILRELVVRTRGPLTDREEAGLPAIEPRLTIREAHRAFATSRRMEAALASHHGFATYAREFAFSHAVYKAHAAGQPLDPAHSLPMLQQGSIRWASKLAHRNVATVATTGAAFTTSAVATATDRERQDLPRFFGMTSIEFVTASLQTILAAHRRGAKAVTLGGGAHTLEIDWSIFELTELMLAVVDASGEEVARFRKRTRADGPASLNHCRRGPARRGQKIIRAHKTARIAAFEKKLTAETRHTPAWKTMCAGYDTAIDAAPAADQCVPAYWYNPEHDLPFWSTFQRAVKEPAPEPASGQPATRRDALMLELTGFATWAPRLIAALLPTQQTALAVTWLAHGFVGIAADPDFAVLR
ncbi:MAG: hypothetical protein PGN23_07285 [Sphingomonas adhaesiva]|uniref:hypothetical protein n=1 Tax=Sphingomonas adhaesiva TaxID=28212 RepID=UPI002FF73481